MEEEGKVALRALAMAEANRRTLNAIMEVLGLIYDPLPETPEEVRALESEADRLLLEEELVVSLFTLRSWTRKLLRITPQWLRLVKSYTKHPSPWQRYLSVTDRLLKFTTTGQLEHWDMLYGALELARRNLQQAAYLASQATSEQLPEHFDGKFDTRVLELLALCYDIKAKDRDNPR